MGMRIDDEIYVHGYLDEIRQDKVIVRNEGGYFGTVIDELVEAIPKADYETRLKAEREKIAEDVAEKMNYMGSCLNEKNIILGVITGKRETLDSLCSTCKSESCASNGTAISKADYENRLKADMVAMLEELQLEIEKNGIVDFEETYVDDGECIISVRECNRLIQQKINSLKAESEDNK